NHTNGDEINSLTIIYAHSKKIQEFVSISFRMNTAAPDGRPRGGSVWLNSFGQKLNGNYTLDQKIENLLAPSCPEGALRRGGLI
ncbi:MAG: hypothetical protein WCB46_07670, partial [Methanoregula sp.]